MTLRTLVRAAAPLLVLLGMAACGTAPAPTAAPALVATPAASVQPQATFAPPTPAPPTQAAPASPEPAAQPVAQSWTMPDLVGANLQDAQDTIQQVTGFGIPITTSHDESGEDRSQVLDRNWKVCTQNVEPGATITSASRIDFGAVKLDERC